MLRRSWRLLSGLAGRGGFAAFQLKVEEGQSNPLLPSQQQKLKAFYHASQAVAHLPSVVDVARALVYKGYEANKSIITPSPRNNNHHNRTHSRSRSPSGSSTSKNSSSSRRLSSSSNNSSSSRTSSVAHRRGGSEKKNKCRDHVAASADPNSRLPPPPRQAKRKSLSVKKDSRPAKMFKKSMSSSSSSSSAVSYPPLTIPSTSHSLVNKAIGSSAISAKTSMKAATVAPATRKSFTSSSPSPNMVLSSSPHGSKTKTMKTNKKKDHRPSRPKLAAKKQKTLTLKEKIARRRYNGFRRTVLKVSGLKEGPKLDLRMHQLWHLLLKKRVKPEKRITVAIRVLRPKALQKMKRLKATRSAGATPLSSLRKTSRGGGGGGWLLSTSRRPAGLKASAPLLSGMSKKEIEKQKYIKFRDAVMAKTGGTPSDAEHRHRIHELWKILLSKSITLQERIAIAVRVLGPKEKKPSSPNAKSEKRRDVKGGVHHPPAPHRVPTSFRSSTPKSRALSLDRVDSADAKKNDRGTFSSSSSLMSKGNKDQGTFLAFRTAVMSSVKMTPQQRPKVEKALRGLWSILLKKHMSFDQRVSVATKMLIESLKQLERSVALSRRPLVQKKKEGKGGMGGARGQMRGNESNSNKKKKKSHSKSNFMGLHSSPQYDVSLTPMEGALPRPPGGVTIATSSGAVMGVGGAAAHGSGHVTSVGSGAGKHNFGRRPLSKKQLDFLAFYRAMLMTGHISRDPTERSKTIKYLWGNTRHLKNLEARIKLSEAHLAGAIRFPLVPNEASGSSAASGTMTTGMVTSPSSSSTNNNNNNNNVGSVGSVGTGNTAWNSSKSLKTS